MGKKEHKRICSQASNPTLQLTPNKKKKVFQLKIIQKQNPEKRVVQLNMEKAATQKLQRVAQYYLYKQNNL